MKILAIDPGTEQSAWVLWEDGDVADHGKEPNDVVLARLMAPMADRDPVYLALEAIASYGMAVGAEVFTTCIWVGRFIQAWVPRPYELIYRRQVKLHLCDSARANDANIRQALIDRFGQGTKAKAIGTKAAPGPLYGLKADRWAALGVALTFEALRAAQAQERAEVERVHREAMARS